VQRSRWKGFLPLMSNTNLTLSCSSGTSFLKSSQSISKVAKTAIEDIDQPYLSIEWPSVVGHGSSA
jgi:hypothetical protein